MKSETKLPFVFKDLRQKFCINVFAFIDFGHKHYAMNYYENYAFMNYRQKLWINNKGPHYILGLWSEI
jgi:hypothetical protein